MTATLDFAELSRLTQEPISPRHKGLPVEWAGHSTALICRDRPRLFSSAPMGPVCVLREDALRHNLTTMARWCDEHGVQLAPHGKTHMSPQLAARQLAAGACGITVATASQARTYRTFGVTDLMLANELVDPAGLRWVASELTADPDFRIVCWADSVAGVRLMTEALAVTDLQRPLDVCVEVGAYGGRTGCRTTAEADAVAAAVLAAPALRLTGVAGYEGALGHDISPAGRAPVRAFLAHLRNAALRLAPLVEADQVLVTAGGSTHFDLVAEMLTGWPAGLDVRTVLRSGCYLTHDDGLYHRTSPLPLRPALSVWAQVCSTPEPGLALLTMGRRDVSFDSDLPIARDVPGASVTRLNDQHAFLQCTPDAVQVGDWLEFGISHPCTVFDKWPMIPVLDAEDRVVDVIRTFF